MSASSPGGDGFGAQPHGGTDTRLVTFNIQHGRTPAGTVEPPLVGDACAVLDADVLALQEVDAGASRSHRAHLARIAGAATGMTGVFAPALRLRGGGRYGNALLVRGRIDDVEVVRLPGRRRAEPRVAVVATAAVTADRAISVAVTHLGVRGEAVMQLPAVVAALLRRGPPRVLLGDLNLEPAAVETLTAGADLTLAPGPPTYPARQPRRRIDHVAASGFDFGTVTAPASAVGDHRPLVAEAEPRR